MASVSDEVSTTTDNTVELSPSENQHPTKNEEVKEADVPQPAETNENKSIPATTTTEVQEETQPSTSIEPQGESQPNPSSLTVSEVQEEKSSSQPVKEVKKEKPISRAQEEEPALLTSKSRSVNFASTLDDIEMPKSRSKNSTNTRTFSSSTSKSSYKPVDFVDTLVDSYKLETTNTSLNTEEKKYVPKTSRSRLNPNWREHRTRRLMNKLEELSLWDREEELKASQAQALREQKWEQIQDRQRNHDLCLNLMRQRHESEMESAVTLDRAATGANDENTTATIARAMNLATPANILAYDLPTPPQTLKRRVRQDQEKSTELKTPIARFRQFETNMDNKLEKINQKLRPDHEIMRAYSPYRTSIPPTAVPLFSETYAALLAVPDTNSTNKYNQYHYGVAPHSYHSPQHAASPDFEARLRSYSNRDVRVPLKEQANDYGYYDDEKHDDYHRSNYLDTDHYNKYRSNPIENDYYLKYRSISADDDHHHPKHRSNQLDDDYHLKHRSNPVDDDYYNKYRSNPIAGDDDYYSKYRSTVTPQLDYSPPRRTTSMASPTASALYDFTTVANTPRDYSFIHSRQPASTSIHLRSLNDDLNAITRYSTETSKKILQNIGDLSNDLSNKNRSTSSSKHVSFHNSADDNDDYPSYNSSSRTYSSKNTYQPVEILSLSSTR